MPLDRRKLLQIGGGAALASLPLWAYAKSVAKTSPNTLKLGITLEPPGLDPTVSASSSISEVCLYNLYETLTKITPLGQVEPLLANSWGASNNLRTYTFSLKEDVFFHNGEPFNAHSVAFSLQRAGADNSTNKDKSFYRNIKHVKINGLHDISLELHQPDPDFPFKLGMGTAIMVEPKSAADNRVNPIGTGPYKLQSWRKGAAIILEQWQGYQQQKDLPIKAATFKFINDTYAQMASLLSGDVDVFARAAIARSLPAFERQPDKFQILVSNSRAKTLVAINNRRKPLDNVMVRQAIAGAIDRAAVIESAADGYGLPIGSHYTPSMQGFIDTTNINPYNPEHAKELLKKANVSLPLKLDFVLPHAPYARQGGEVIAAMLAQIGIHARIQNVEWAQWLNRVYTQHDYDLSMVAHVEPFDLDQYTQKGYYWGYASPAYKALFEKSQSLPMGQERNDVLAQLQRLLAQDAANVWLYQPQWITVANKQLKGLWDDMPIFVNDLSAMSWGS